MKELVNLKFDILLIAIESDKTNIEIKNKLTELGIDEKKILTKYEYEKYYYKELKKSDEITNFGSNVIINGLIFGISYGQAGILPKLIGNGVYNLALASQDLFYNYQQFKRVLERYKEIIKKLKFLILDMFTYTYFNYDLSLSKNGAGLIYDYGFENTTNNLKYNKNYENSDVEEIKKELSREKIALFNEIIDSKKIIRKDNTYFFNKEERNKVVDNSELLFYKYKDNGSVLSSIERIVYSETEEMNIKIFEDFIHDIKEINNDIKIYTVLIPRYKLVEEANKECKEFWKERFYKIIREVQKKYDFKVIDLKDCKEIRDNSDYYYDLEHLNYNGATEFTKILKTYL